MATLIALLRAVNVGGTGKLPMSDLRSLCEAAGFENVRTYIASGNVVFNCSLRESAVKARLERALRRYAGKPVGVVVRTAEEMAKVLAANPFASSASNRTVAIFLDAAPPKDVTANITGLQNEQIARGVREIYVHYGAGMARSKLRIAAARAGTARNMQTIAKLVDLSKSVSEV
jgi:uncharacterized protein (DUF1697 family)